MTGMPQKKAGGEAIVQTVERLRSSFASGRTRSYEWRVQQLDRFAQMMIENEAAMADALKQDLGKPYFESWGGELNFTLGEVKHARKHLRAWMKPRRARAPIVVQPARARIVPEPLGTTLVIAPWNYPIQLALTPVAAALAAGNTVVLKPSEVASASSRIMAELIPKYLDSEAVAVVEGGVPETTLLLEQKWDLIFYTGNGTVGRIVMQAAAKHLTPVVLELGGKSPCIVDEQVDMTVAARRITWGKFYNAGQTCVAPDYILVHKSREAELHEALKSTIHQFFGADPKQSPDYARIINERHHARLTKLLASGEATSGGQHDVASRYIAPTVLTHVDAGSPVMGDEIFGPILPVLPVGSVDEAIEFVNQRDKPLALYVFTSNHDVADRVLARTSSGGAAVNDTMAHLIPHELPFGGVGPSGMGAYHGRSSFDTFSHLKSVLDRPFFGDAPIRYAPYTESKTKWAKRLI